MEEGGTDVNAILATALDDLREQTTPANYRRWLSRLAPQELAGDTLTLLAPDEVTKEQLERRFRPLLQRAVDDAAGCRLELAIMVGERGATVPG